MLGSFGSSSHHEDEEDPISSPPKVYLHHHHHHHHHQINQPTSQPIHMRQLLLRCADLISRADLSAAHRLISILSSNSSPYGDSTERLVHHFTKALSLRLSRHPPPPNDAAILQSSYLSLNQITPFIRFSQLTANQAILEAIDGHHAIHIVDLDVMHGVQWPPLMQAAAERFPPPTLRITGAGDDLDLLRRTGDRLAKFAHSLGLRFQFQPLLMVGDVDDPIDSVVVSPDETLAVNCVHHLHRMLGDRDRDRLRVFLRRLRSMSPAVVAVAEREADHNHPVFARRFGEAVEHYAAVFDSLEATLPPTSRERLAVEGVWFGREIADIVAAEGRSRRERHERFRSWEVMMRAAGFSNLQLSPFALSQAKLLLRLHYPSEGYQLHIINGCFFLGWQNQPLFSVSSWH